MIPKFRAWDKINKEMCDVWEIDFKFIGEILLSDDYDGAWSTFDDVFLMQSTGLKDKNGVEIYEGDIVVNHVGDEWVITYFRGAFRYYPIESFSEEEEKWFETDNIGNFGTEVFEVIGNIHENSDLLN